MKRTIIKYDTLLDNCGPILICLDLSFYDTLKMTNHLFLNLKYGIIITYLLISRDYKIVILFNLFNLT